jgi:hypothetical protein
MRASSPPPHQTRPHRRPTDRARTECSRAEELLGASHPLVTVLRASQTAIEQVLSVATVQAGDLGLVYEKAPFALPLAVAACVVQIALACRLALLACHRRDVCRELIIAGREQLPVAAVERESRRLGEPQRRARLARSMEEVANSAERGRADPGPAGSLVRTHVRRPVASELREIALLLRGKSAPIRGVALVEWLLTAGDSPLYGPLVGPLRQELGRARYFLIQRS